MSVTVDTPKVEETTPVTKPVESLAAHDQTTAATTTEGDAVAPVTAETTSTEPIAKDEAVVEATPATEGILSYKAPGLLNAFRKNKYFFWFSEEPLTQEAVDSYIKHEKAEAHHNAAWAQETGQGVLFYTKRAEDKATPTGMILLPEATSVTKVGSTDFSFKVGNHTHKFEASSVAERDSWVVAVQKVVDDSAHLKAEVTGRESYKKTIEGYAFSPIVAGSASKAAAPKKSLDAATATDAAVAEPVAKADISSASSVEETKKDKAAEKQAKKERSQSRKRNSVFGLFGKKDEEKAEKKAEKEHEKEVKKAEKEHVKEEKKVEAEIKKEEAKAEHDATKAKEAAEATAIAAAPAAVVPTSEKHEEKPIVEEATSPTEKKNKRTSVFGGFFNKSKVTSPSVEKTEREAVPDVPAKDETPAVSETAPKLDEPIDTRPIDAAAVTAPVDTVETTATSAPVAATEEPKVAEPVATPDAAAVTPRTEKKSFLAGVFKKHEKKEEPKEEVKTNEEAAKEVTPITSEPTEAVTEPVAETPVQEADVAKEERPAREKRRTSLFGSLTGTLKRKNEKSPEPSSVAATEESIATAPRSKSPIPRLGGLFRKPSRAVKPEAATEESKTDAVKTDHDASAAVETPANATIVEPKGDSAIVGDVVPENLTSTVHDAVTTKPEEVKASA